MICYYPDPFSLLSSSNAVPLITMMAPSGAIVELRKTGAASYQVQNLISTDPQEYLNGRFRPGQILDDKMLAQCSWQIL